MIARLKITLSQAEYTALYHSALADLRSPSEQAHFLLRRELERLGYLTYKTSESTLPLSLNVETIDQC